jgi:TRAP-type C4-dicarboxylate transport system substrate-binding protein
MTTLTRRSVVAGGAAMTALAAAAPARAQAKPKMRFSSAFTENDLRTEAYKAFAATMSDAFDFEPYWGNTLFKQAPSSSRSSVRISSSAISRRRISPSSFRLGR